MRKCSSLDSAKEKLDDSNYKDFENIFSGDESKLYFGRERNICSCSFFNFIGSKLSGFATTAAIKPYVCYWKNLCLFILATDAVDESDSSNSASSSSLQQNGISHVNSEASTLDNITMNFNPQCAITSTPG